jgi:hypothetical protein
MWYTLNLFIFENIIHQSFNWIFFRDNFFLENNKQWKIYIYKIIILIFMHELNSILFQKYLTIKNLIAWYRISKVLFWHISVSKTNDRTMFSKTLLHDTKFKKCYSYIFQLQMLLIGLYSWGPNKPLTTAQDVQP